MESEEDAVFQKALAIERLPLNLRVAVISVHVEPFQASWRLSATGSF